MKNNKNLKQEKINFDKNEYVWLCNGKHVQPIKWIKLNGRKNNKNDKKCMVDRFK